MLRQLFLIMLVMFSFLSKGQTVSYDLALEEDNLQAYYEKLHQSKTDDEITAVNQQIIDLWYDILYDTESFDYNFSKLSRVGILKSDDSKIRIYNWNILYENGKYKYFAFVQYYKEDADRYYTYFLDDKSDEILRPTKETLGPDNWYGALYYRIIQTEYKDDVYYTLLGWDKNSDLVSNKIIDVLWFSSSGKPRFGKTIFEMNEKSSRTARIKTQKRVIFEYSARASMILQYDPDKGLIYFDHLAPIDEKYDGIYQFYAPDLTQDGMEFKKGRWLFINDIEPSKRMKKPDNKNKPQSNKFY